MTTSHTSPHSSSYPLVYSPSENSYQNTPSMSADIHECPFDLGLTSSSSMSFAEFDLSQSAFLSPGQLPWSDSKSELKIETSHASQPVFYADSGNYTFYNGNPAIDTQFFTSQSQPQESSEMLTSAPQQVVYSTENEMEMEGDLDLRYLTSSASPHALPPTATAPTFVHPSEVMSPSPPAFAPVSFPRVPGSSSPPGLTGESDEDLGSESGESESEAAYPSEGVDGDDDGDFMPNRAMSRSRTRSRRTSSVSESSGSGSVRVPRPCRLSAPVPVPNLTKKSRGRRVPTAPVIIVQGGVQKDMRMYRCTVEGCYKCFARGEHLKRHVRSIHTNEKRECFPPQFLGTFLTFRFSAQVSRRGMREGFQPSRQSRAAYACTQGSSLAPHARRCLNSSYPQTKLAIKPSFLFSRPTHAHVPSHNLPLFLNSFYHLALLLFYLYFTWAQVSPGTLQPP